MMNQVISKVGDDELQGLSSVNKTEELIKLIPNIKTKKHCIEFINHSFDLYIKFNK